MLANHDNKNIPLCSNPAELLTWKHALCERVSKCFEVGANSGKAGGCDNRGCLSQANCYDQCSQRYTVK